MIPTEKTEPKHNISSYHWLIYGQPKIGKSTFVSQFGKVLFIPTEPGLEALSVYKATDKEFITSWVQFAKICSEIEEAVKAGTFDFEMVCIDTADNLLKFCSDYICKKEAISHPSDQGYGKGWALLNDEFKRVLSKLATVTKIIFISHSVERDIKTRTMELVKTMPTLSGQAGQFIVDFVSIIGYITTDPNNSEDRIIYFRGNEALVAGDRSNKLDPMMPFDYNIIKQKFDDKKETKTKQGETK